MTPKDDKKMALKWTRPTPPGSGATVGERVEYSLTEVIRRFFELFDDPLAELGSWPFRLLIKVMEKSTADYMRPVLDHAIANMDESDPLRGVLLALRDPTGEGALGILAGMGAGAGQAGLLSVFEPLFETARQRAYSSHPSRIYDLPTWIALSWRGMPPDADLGDLSRRLGFRYAWAPALAEVLRPRPAWGELGALKQRGVITPQAFISELAKRGYTPEDATNLERLLHIIPAPDDIIRMAVREAFSPEYVSKYGLLGDLPGEFVEWAGKVGLDAEWAQRYWAAHWVLPSASMGFEMMHRRVIDPDEMADLLRALDYSPYWRDKLIEISYNPLTRVDVRRMYDFGVVTSEDVYQNYLDLGYSPENADRLRRFTVALYDEEAREASRTDIVTAYREGVVSRDEAKSLLLDAGYLEWVAETHLLRADYLEEQEARRQEEESYQEETATVREATKGDITGAYKDGILTRGEAETYLTAIDYPSDLADLYLQRVDYQRKQELIKETITTVHTLFVDGRIELPEVYQRLNAVNATATQVARLVELWALERERKTERPSVSQVITFYYQDIIPRDTAETELGKHGLSAEYVSWYLADADRRILERETKEQERLLKEQERETASEFRDSRRVALNELDIQIQEIRVYIAELKVIALSVEDPETLDFIKQEIVNEQAEITRLQLAKLQHPVLPPE